MVRRIDTKDELLEFVIEKYRTYNNAFNNEISEHISKWYLKDFLTDLLIIQHFASKKEVEDEAS